MQCPLCRQRKAKRYCPAVRHDICPVCCGTKRLVQISCPHDCVYLDAAQRHPAAVVKRQQEHDIGVLMAAVGRLSERQLQLFFLLQTFIGRHAPEGMARLIDADVAEAAAALAATFETAERGVLYEHQAQSVMAEGLRRELKAFLDQVGRGAGARFAREAAVVLRGIERGARHDVPGVPEGASGYLELVNRVLQERPGSAGSSAGGEPPSTPSSGIIIP